MSTKKLGILAIIAVIMVIWAVTQSRQAGRPASGPNRDRRVRPSSIVAAT